MPTPDSVTLTPQQLYSVLYGYVYAGRSSDPLAITASTLLLALQSEWLKGNQAITYEVLERP